jgi:uncharacterized repeat protein (TIGR01451 family)
MKNFLLYFRTKLNPPARLYGILLMLLVTAGMSYGQSASIKKTGPENAAPGDLLTYTITYSNTGTTLLKNAIIEDQLPSGNFEYVSSFPSGLLSGNTITWTKDEIPSLASLNAGNYTIFVTLRAGVAGTGPTQYTGAGGYYISSNTEIIYNAASIVADGLTEVTSAPAQTTITQICTGQLSSANGVLKSATNLTFFYRVVLTNTGNVWNRWNLTALNLPTSEETLLLSFLELDGVTTLTQTPWIEPGGTFTFIYKLQSGQGTNPNKWNYSQITAAPVACGEPFTQVYDTYICGGGPACTGYNLLSTYKIDTPDPVQSGGTLTYTIIIIDANDDKANNLTNVRLTETYPSGFNYVSASPAPTSGNNIWDFPILNKGITEITITGTVDLDLPNGTVLNNYIAVSNAGTIYADYTEPTTVLSAPDLYINKTANITEGSAGDMITYTIEYANNGNRTSPNTTILDNYDENYLDITSGTATNDGSELIWTLGSLAPGASGTLSYTAQIKNDMGLFPAGSTNIDNFANISSDLADKNNNDNVSSATVIVFNLPDLSVVKTVSSDPAVFDEVLTYTITVSNIGMVAHAGGSYTVTDILPAGVVVSSTTPTATITGNTVVWTISDDLGAGSSREFTITLEALDCALVGTVLSNEVTVYSDTYNDGNRLNNEFTLLTNVVDETDPVVNLEDGSSTVECLSLAIVPEIPTATDNCSGTINGELVSIVDTPNPFTCEGTRIYTYSFTDASNNVSYWTYTYTIELEPFPAITPTTATVACVADIVMPALPVVVDNCGNTLDPVAGIAPTAPACEGDMVYTWTYTDCEGNFQVYTHTVTIEYLPFPAITPTTATVACVADIVMPALPVVVDNCGNTLTGVPGTAPTAPDCEGDMVYTWTYTDCEGNFQVYTHTVTIELEPFPAIAPTTATVACVADIVLPTLPTVVDNCGNTLDPVAGIAPTAPACEGDMVYTWTYTDCEGNFQVYTHTVTIEYLPFPAITPTTATVACVADIVMPALPVVVDNCGNTLNPVAGIAPTAPACEGDMVYTWTYTDCEGNFQVYTHTVTIEYLPFPAITPTTATVACVADIVMPALPVVVDNCGNTLTGVPGTAPTAPDCEGDMVYTWTYTDCEGNFQVYTHTVTIEYLPFPAITPTTATVACVADIVMPALPVVVDNCGNTLTGVPGTAPTAPDCEGDMVYTWTYTDCEGNFQVYTHTVTIEYLPFPAITPTTATVACAADIVMPTLPTVVDNCGNTLTGVPGTAPTAPDCEGDMVYTWTYTDCEGNFQVYTHTVTIEYLPFPAITPTTATVACAADIVMPTLPTVVDNCGNPLTPVAGPAPTAPACEGDMVYTWTYTDCEGNFQVYTHTVTIELEPFPAIAPTTATVACVADIVMPTLPTVVDNCGNTLTGVPGTVPTAPDCEGDMVYTWTYTDCEGNFQVYTHTVTIEIIEFTMPSDNGTIIACAAAATQPTPPSVNDNCGNPITPTGPTVGGTYVDCGGTITYTWNYADCEGNNHDWVYTYAIILTTPPVVPADGYLTVECISDIEVPITPTVSDFCGNSIIPELISVVDFPNPLITEGIKIYTYRYTDCAGNSTDWKFTYTIDDTQNPTLSCISDITKSVDSEENYYTVSGSEFNPTSVDDNCGIASLVNSLNGGNTLAGEQLPLGETIITWVVTDNAGNTATCSYTVTVVDDEPPVINCGNLSDENVSTDPGNDTYAVVGAGWDATASDNDEVISIKYQLTGDTTSEGAGDFQSLAGVLFNLGTTTVTWTATDNAGLTAVCSFTVNVTDNEDPEITCAAGSPFTRDTDMGEDTYTVQDSEFDASFTDNVAGGSITNDYNNAASLAGAVLQLGETTILWTATDEEGNTATCTTVVNVEDNEDPEITCADGSPFTRDTDMGEDTYTVMGSEFDASFTDNVAGGSITNDYNNAASLAGAVLQLGGTTIVWTATDEAGNTATCTTVVNVEDNEDPEITCAAGSPFTRDTDMGQDTYTVMGSEFDASFTDNVAGGSITNDYNNAASLAGAVLQLGGTTIVWTATDEAGNTATCTTVVNVEDNEDPEITCAAGSPFTRDTDMGQDTYTVMGSEFDASFTDNVAGGSITNDYNNAASLAGAVLQLGGTTIVWTATDEAGNTATCTTVVNVEDNEDPEITCAAGSPFTRDTDMGQDTYTVMGSEFDASFTDNVAGGSITNDYNNAASLAGAVLQLGGTTIVWTATDEAGNTATCTTVVNVEDNEDPEITCAAGSPFTRDTDMGQDTYTVMGSEFDASFTDNVAGGSITNDYNNAASLAGAVLQLGETTIVWTATDEAGNTATCTTVVNLEDNEDPEITCAAGSPFTRDTDMGEDTYTVMGSEFDASFTDNVAGGSITNDYNNAASLAGAVLQLGGTTIVWTATDEAGNTATCTTVVNVEDNEDPEITCAAGSPFTRDTDMGENTYTVLGSEFDASFTDNVAGGSITNDYNNAASLAGAVLQLGETTIVWTATDEAGNTATCTTVVNVEDNEDPEITCATPETAYSNDEGECSFTVQDDSLDPIVSDNDAVKSIINDYNGSFTLEGAKFPLGSTIVTWIVEDESGNTATCQITINLEDTTNPEIITCAPTQTISAGEECTALVPDFTVNVEADDNCDASVEVNLTITQSPAAGTVVGIGTHTITLTVEDEAGNTTICQTVLFVEDTTPPAISSVENLEIDCAMPGNEDLIKEWLDSVTATDNCSDPVNVTYNIDLETFDISCDNAGETTVIWTATDEAGNTATTSAMLIINDTRIPTFDDVVGMTVECDGEGNLDEWDTFISQFVILDFPDAYIEFSNDTTYGCGSTISVMVNAVALFNSVELSTLSATFTIIDTTPPMVVAPADITIEAGENCEWDANTEITGMATASDDCSGEAGVALTYADVEEDMGKGVIIITRTWTAVDACGNSATDQQVITVTGGNAPPELVLNEIDIYLTIEGQWTLNRFDIEALTAGSAAGCGADDDLNFVVNPRYFHCADVFAPVEITVTASDSRGNSASGKVYVNVYDTIAPIAYCKDTTIYLDSFGQTLIVPGAVNQGGDRESVPEWARYHNNLEGGSIDACGIQNMDLSKQIFTCNDIGENIVTLTVYDPSGNFATCQAVVTVIDPIAPVFVPVADLEFTAEPGVCETSIPYPQIVATDNCPVVPELVEGLGANGAFPLGTTTETWKAVDASGNEAWLTFNVTVKTYNAPPTIAAIEDIVVDEDPILIEIPLTNITPNVDCDDQQIISLQVSTDNPELITALNLEYVMGETTGTLLVTVGPNMNGEAWVTITVKDNGGTANGGSDTTVETFKITVVPVPDMPEVTAPVGPIAINPGEEVSIDLNDVFSNPDDEGDLTYDVTLSDGTPLPEWVNFDPETGVISGTPGDDDAGAYEVTVVATNSNGDSVETTFTVVIVKPGTSVIAGTVLAADGPVTGGISAMLFKVDINNLHHAVATVAVAANGTFAFYNLENGTYLVKAVVTNAEMHPTLFHTWYETAISVLEASAIIISQPGIENIQLTMVDGLVADGNYTIEGRILSKTGDDETPVPAAYVDVVLKQDGIIVAVTMTDQNGNYTFEGLPAGTYDVFVEVPGYDQEITAKITLNDGNQSQDDVNFTIWITDDRIITDVEIIGNTFDLKMYPNPSQGMVNIDMTWNDIRKVEVSVFNLVGAKVFSKEFQAGNLINFDLSKQVTGMYLVRIDADGQSIIKKLVLDRK